MMARSATGNFAHQLGALSCVVNVDSPETLDYRPKGQAAEGLARTSGRCEIANHRCDIARLL
jgi:hypothetical protein